MSPEGPPPQSGAPRPPPRRRWLARCLMAVGGPVVLFSVSEIALRLAGFGNPVDFFIPDEKAGFYRTNPAFTAPFFPRQFDITPLNFRIAGRKEPGHVRVFVLGESAARGTPEPGFGFASQLGPQLRSAYPGREVEVYNLGIVAINSHVVYQLARELPWFEPDLFVVYLGNNEVVGPYGPGSANLSASPPLAVIRASIWVSGTRTGQLVQRIIGRLFPGRSGALQWKGMSTFEGKTVRGDDPRLEAVYHNFEANLRDILGIARKSGVKTVLATVVANLRDSPPFASLHRPGMTDSELAAWNAGYVAGLNARELGHAEEALRKVTEASKADPEYAEAHFVLGSLLEEKGDTAQARSEYIQALHWDALRFRPDPRINAIARKVAADSGSSVVLVDLARDLGSDPESKKPPVGKGILLEHVHFNWDGNVLVGRRLAEVSGSALFGAAPPGGRWLDASACAKGVGYTELGRLRMLRQMEPIRGKAPFTGQLTFGEDQVRYQQEIFRAEADAANPETLVEALQLLEAAAARSPEVPAIQLRLSEAYSQTSQPDRMLECIDRALGLAPRSPEVLVMRARALLALKRGPEAEETAIEALRMDPYDLPSYTAFVETLRLTGDFERGRGVFTAALARNPGSAFIRLSYADLLFFHGDRDQAVQECLSVLAKDGADEDALRRLESLYTAEGKKQEAFDLMVKARAAQPLNFENNLGLARAYDEKGDEDNTADCLLAAARSGPVTAQVHVFLARHLSKLGRPQEALVELARGERVALLAGDTETARHIEETMAAVGRD